MQVKYIIFLAFAFFPVYSTGPPTSDAKKNAIFINFFDSFISQILIWKLLGLKNTLSKYI